MKATSRQTSELNPPKNITPSVGTTINGILILLPLSLFLLGLFTGLLNI
ncbi:MAG: purine permease [Xenococcaceae cyanobacterium]